jgi:hypothetical protein
MSGDLTPAQRRLSAQRAAYTRWSRVEDRAAALEPARDGFTARLERQVDPDGRMTPKQRAKAVKSARRAFYADLGARSAAARRKRREGAA